MTRRCHPGLRLAALATAVSMLSACGAGTPPPRIYVLGDAPEIGPATVSLLNHAVVEVRSVRLPDYLDTTEILTRQPGGRIVARERGQWGERLSIGVTRAVAASLEVRLPQLAVTTSPLPGTVSWQVLIDIDEFEVQPDGQCVLMARWGIWRVGSDRNLGEEKVSLVTPVQNGSDEAVVEAMIQLVDQLAAQIAPPLETETRLTASDHMSGVGTTKD